MKLVEGVNIEKKFGKNAVIEDIEIGDDEMFYENLSIEGIEEDIEEGEEEENNEEEGELEMD
jgi:hypothetical protein